MDNVPAHQMASIELLIPSVGAVFFTNHLIYPILILLNSGGNNSKLFYVGFQLAQGYFNGSNILNYELDILPDIAILIALVIRFFYQPQRAQRTQRERKDGKFLVLS